MLLLLEERSGERTEGKMEEERGVGFTRNTRPGTGVIALEQSQRVMGRDTHEWKTQNSQV